MHPPNHRTPSRTSLKRCLPRATPILDRDQRVLQDARALLVAVNALARGLGLHVALQDQIPHVRSAPHSESETRARREPPLLVLKRQT